MKGVSPFQISTSTHRRREGFLDTSNIVLSLYQSLVPLPPLVLRQRPLSKLYWRQCWPIRELRRLYPRWRSNRCRVPHSNSSVDELLYRSKGRFGQNTNWDFWELLAAMYWASRLRGWCKPRPAQLETNAEKQAGHQQVSCVQGEDVDPLIARLSQGNETPRQGSTILRSWVVWGEPGSSGKLKPEQNDGRKKGRRWAERTWLLSHRTGWAAGRPAGK